MIKQFVDEKQSGNQSGGIATIAYNLQVMDKENEIIIGEKDKLTDSAYKSILSGLEVMYGKETADKFKSLYPSFKTEKTVVGAFTIDTTYTEEDSEMYEGMKLVKVTIDNKKVNK